MVKLRLISPDSRKTGLGHVCAERLAPKMGIAFERGKPYLVCLENSKRVLAKRRITGRGLVDRVSIRNLKLDVARARAPIPRYLESICRSVSSDVPDASTRMVLRAPSAAAAGHASLRPGRVLSSVYFARFRHTVAAPA